MSKPCRRPTRVAIKKLRSEKKTAGEGTEREAARNGDKSPTQPLHCPTESSAFATVDEEQKGPRGRREQTDCASCAKSCPPCSLNWKQIPDPRDPKKSGRHKLTVLLLYGLADVSSFSSLPGARGPNRENIPSPVFMTNLQLLFPEIDTLPHADTLFRLFARH
jgi:hypothetical protein